MNNKIENQPFLSKTSNKSKINYRSHKEYGQQKDRVVCVYNQRYNFKFLYTETVLPIV